MSFSQIGPGGVGNTTNTELWLRADMGASYALPDYYVWQWIDQSGKGRNFLPVVDGQNLPSKILNGINGYPCINFDDKGGVNGALLGTEIGVGISGSDAATIVFVARNQTVADEKNSGLYLGQKNLGKPGEVRMYGLEHKDAVRFNGENQVFDDGHTAGTWGIAIFTNPEGATVSDYSAWLNGALLSGNSSSSTVPSLVGNYVLLGASQIGGVYNPEGYFDGDIAEVLVFSSELNDATKVILDNSLAAKYMLSIDDDHFQWQNTHSFEVSGIAGYNGTTFTSGWSSTLMSINSPDDLSDDEYLLYGHDNGATEWTTTEVPASGTYRLAREWRIDETGSVGNVTVTIPAASLPAFPADYSKVAILTDADGNFTSGATLHEATLSAGSYNVTLDLTTGQYIAIACFRPEIAFSVASATGAENVATVTVQAKLNYPFLTDISADYTAGGTATNGADYTLGGSAITIPSGSLTSSFSFTVTDDIIVEDDETVILTLSNPTPGITVGAEDTYTYTIIDNDAVFVSFSAATASENEGNASRSVLEPTLRISGDIITASGTVTLTVTNGTATSDDWSQSTAVVTVPAGNYTTPSLINIPALALSILGDNLVENDETITLNLNTFALVDAGTIINNTYTIVNDDNATMSVTATTPTVTEGGPGPAGTGTFTFALTNPCYNERTVTYSVAGTAGSGTDYSALSGTVVIPANTLSVTATLTPVADLLVEGDETVSVTITNIAGTPAVTINASPAVMTIDDDDVPAISVNPTSISMNEGASATIEVWLDNPPVTPVTLNIGTLNTGLLTFNPTTLTFTSANYSTHQVITLQSVENNVMGDKTDKVIISVNDASSDDMFDPLANVEVPVTIINNDVASIIVSPSNVTVAENGTATFTVVLSAGPASGNVLINLSSNNTGVATIDKGGMVFNTSNWNVPQTITVTGVNNNTIPNTSTTISLLVNAAPSDDNYDGKSATVTVNVTNDDVAGFTVTPLTLNLDEGGPAGSFTIVLTAQPLSNVVFNLVNASPVYVTSASSVTFTTANWNTPQTVTVTPTDDALDADYVDYIVVTINQASTDNSFDALASKTVTVNIDDNDPPIITGCPANITTINSTGICGAVVSWIAPSSTATMTSTHNPGETFPAGTTTVTYTSSDDDGTSTCIFTVTVNDTESPVFSSCPAPIVKNNTTGTCSMSITTPNAVVSDNCGVVSLTWVMTGATVGSSDPTGIHQVGTYTFEAGVTTVTYTAKDAAGNSATCIYTVTVTDTAVPVFTSCPSPISANNTPGSCSASVVTPDAVVTDNCSLASLTWAMTGATAESSSATGFNQVGTHTFNKGETTVTYTAKDGAGNTSTCTFKVTVTDNEKPVIVCTADMTVNSDAGSCSATVTVPGISPTDNCGVTSLTWIMTGATTAMSQTAGIQQIGTRKFNTGATLITYTVKDAAGNSAKCSFTVTVADDVIPVFISCPADITKSNINSVCFASVTTPNAVVSDNCGVVSLSWAMTGATVASSAATGINQVGNYVFNVGETTVTYTAKDNSGNSAYCSFKVTVNDIQTPVILCPGNIVEDNTAGECTADIVIPDPTMSDNCGIDRLTWVMTGETDDSSPSTGINQVGSHIFNSGETTLEYTVTDMSGNTQTCSYTVTVIDTEKPVVTCPGDLSATTPAGECSATVSAPDASVSDNCGAVERLTWAMTGATVENSAATGINQVGDYVFNAGVTVVTYTATDAAGNSATCEYTVTVTDIENPSITCPGDISANSSEGNCSASVSPTDVIAGDNCGVESLTWTMTGSTTAGSSLTGINQVGTYTFNVGETTVTYIVKDAAGNSETCSYKVTVTDIEDPVVTCPGDLSADNSAGSCSATLTPADAIFADNCGAVESLTWSMTGATIDNSLLTGINQVGTYTFNAGETTVTYTATDKSGNSGTCSYKVTVVDKELPSITCQGDVSADNLTGTCSAPVTITDATITDNCGAVVSLTWVMTGVTEESSLSSGINQIGTHIFNKGVTTVTYTATDGAGNSATCSFAVTVNDVEAPVVTCTGDINADNTAGTCSALITIPDAVINDNCEVVTLTWAMTGSTEGASGTTGINQIGTYTFNAGVTTVTFTAEDEAGNTDNCSFTVTVTDTEAPEIVCAVPELSYPTDDGKCSYVVPDTSLDPTSTSDNCGVTSVSNDYTGTATLQGAEFTAGTHVVTWTATDDAALTATCQQTITVVDLQAPVIVSCPSPIEGYLADAYMCSATGLSLGMPVATDNCGSSSAEAFIDEALISDPSIYNFPVGTTIVTWKVTDDSGNVSTCTQSVEVIDAQDPMIICSGDITIPSSPGICGATATWSEPAAVDNCSDVVITSSHEQGAIFPVGVLNTVTYTATDQSGNKAECSFIVTVYDAEAPVIVPNDTIVYINASGIAPVTEDDVTDDIYDNCAISSTSLDRYTFDCSDIGINIITITATDINGLVATINAIVEVRDTLSPVIPCTSATVYLDESGNASITVDDLVTTPVTDNCTTVTYTLSKSEFTCSDLGDVPVTITASDGNGNIGSCTSTVTVVDNFAVVVSAGPDLDVCASDLSVSITDASVNNGTVLWSTSGSGTFNDATLINPVYTFGAGDNAGVALTVTATKTKGCGTDVVTDVVDVTFVPVPVIYAGDDITGCIGAGSINITGATSTGGSIVWTTSGDGSFVDPSVLNPVYNPGPTDLTTVTLTLTVTAGSCPSTTDDMELTMVPSPVANAGSGTSLCSSSDGFQVTGASHSGGTVLWSTSGDGTFDDNTIDNPYYTFGAADARSATVTLTMAVTGPGLCPVIESSIELVMLPSPGISVTAHSDISCNGLTDGSVSITGTGGIPPYSYDIDGSGLVATGDFGSLVAGVHIFSVKDQTGCASDTSVTIIEPGIFTFALDSVEHVACFGETTGAIYITLEGGWQPYNVSWTGPDAYTSSDEDITGLAPGSYSLAVTDLGGCGSFTLDTTITEASEIVVTVDTVSDRNGYGLSCYGGNDAFIETTSGGGSGTLSLLWEGPDAFTSTSDDIYDLGVGSYRFTVTDTAGCFVINDINISQPTQMNATYQIEKASCPGVPDGEITLTVDGGAGTLAFGWSDGFTGQNRTEIAGGVYSVTITDMNGCTIDTTLTVELTGYNCLKVPEIITPNGDGFNDTWVLGDTDVLSLYPDIEVKVYTRWGKLVYSSRNPAADPWDGTFKGTLLPNDSYHYIIYLNDGSEPRSGVISIISK